MEHGLFNGTYCEWYHWDSSIPPICIITVRKYYAKTLNLRANKHCLSCFEFRTSMTKKPPWYFLDIENITVITLNKRCLWNSHRPMGRCHCMLPLVSLGLAFYLWWDCWIFNFDPFLILKSWIEPWNHCIIFEAVFMTTLCYQDWSLHALHFNCEIILVWRVQSFNKYIYIRTSKF